MAIRSTSLISPTNTLLDTVLSGYKWDISSDSTISLGASNGYLGIIGDPQGLDSSLTEVVLGLIASDLERFLPIDFDPSSPGLSGSYVHPNAFWSTADITFSPYNPTGWGPLAYNLSSDTMGIAEFPYLLGYQVEPSNLGVDVLLNEIYLSPQNMAPGGVGFSLIYHELGHALGLKHPFSLLNGFDNFEAYGLSRDPGKFITTMSYEDPSQVSVDGYGGSFGFMALDVLALQYLYGKREDFNTGNNIYDLSIYSSTYGDIWYTLYDCGGSDTVSCESANESWIINLSQGYSSSTSGSSGVWLLSNRSSLSSFFQYTENAYENITGSSYTDTLTGNSANNTIDGGSGNSIDKIDGSTGTDTISFASLTASSSTATGVTLNLGAVLTTGSAKGYSVASGLGGADWVKGIENITGSKYKDTLTGNSSANTLNGGSGDDVIDGGSGTAIDKIDGSTGTDTISFASLTASSSTATGVTLNLGAVLTTGSAKGYSVASGLGGADWVKGIENVTGSKYADVLTGNGANNVINGGAGKDTLTGGSGADKFIFDTALNESNNLDTIKYFVKGTDKIVLDDDIFTAFAGKTSNQLATLLKPTVVDSTAKLSTTNGYLTYVTANDTLYYDSNGSGSGDVAFVKVEPAGTAAPAYSDFQVIA